MSKTFKQFLQEKVNDKIFWSDFRETKDILDGEYTLVATHGWIKLNAKPAHKSDQFKITAKKGNIEVGWVNFEKYDDHLEALDLAIQPAHRRKGIATAMYKFARELGNDIKPSRLQTGMGKQFWSKKDHSVNEDWEGGDFGEYSKTEKRINKEMRAKGYKLIGSGIEKAAYKNKSTGEIILLIDTSKTSQDSFIRWYNYCKEHSHNHFLPQFAGYEYFEIDGKHYIQARVERLFDVKIHGVDQTALESISEIISNWSPNFNKCKEAVEKYIEALDDHEELVLTTLIDDLDLFIKTIIDLEKYSSGTDLHSGNFMLSSEGTVVINDPWHE